MKKTILFSSLLISATIAFSQQNNPKSTLTKEDLMQKSKQKRNTGRIILFSGLVLGAASTITAISDGELYYLYLGALGGGGIVIASIPFFNASARYKTKALSLSLSNQQIPSLQKSNAAYHPIPSLKLKISL